MQYNNQNKKGIEIYFQLIHENIFKTLKATKLKFKFESKDLNIHF